MNNDNKNLEPDYNDIPLFIAIFLCGLVVYLLIAFK